MFGYIYLWLFCTNPFLLLLSLLLLASSFSHFHTNIHNISFLQTVLLDIVSFQILVSIYLILASEILLVFHFLFQIVLSVSLIPCFPHSDLSYPHNIPYSARKRRCQYLHILPVIYRRLGKNLSPFVTSVFLLLSSLSPTVVTIFDSLMPHIIRIYCLQ